MSTLPGWVDGPEQLEDGSSPIKLIRGRLEPVGPPHPDPDKNGQMTRSIQLTEIEVLATKAGFTYAFPTWEIGLKYSPKKRSVWGVFLGSLVPFGVGSIQDLAGQFVTLRCDRKDWGINPDTQEKMEGDIWLLDSIGGYSAAEVAEEKSEEERTDSLIKLLHGKNATDFVSAALQTQEGRDKTEEIMDGSFISKLIADGIITVDDAEIHHIAGLTN